MQKFEFLCPNHITELQSSEQSAMAYWCEMMRRGGKAYSQCRVEASELYFHAATEICLLRRLCRDNAYFSDLHITKPLDFLLELFIQNQSYTKARALLNKVSGFFKESFHNSDVPLDEYLEKAYQRVEEEEKRFLYERRFDSLGAMEVQHGFSAGGTGLSSRVH